MSQDQSLTESVLTRVVIEERNPTDGDIPEIGHNEEEEVQYTEVQPPPLDPHRVPVSPGTDTVYSEVSSSTQVAMNTAVDGESVEYAQLNHGDGNHDNHHHDNSVKQCTVRHNGSDGVDGDHCDQVANQNGCSDNGDHSNQDDCVE